MEHYSSGSNSIDNVDQLRSILDEAGIGMGYRLFVLLAIGPLAIGPGLLPVVNNAQHARLFGHHNAELAQRIVRHISGPVMPVKKSSPTGHCHPWSCLGSGHKASYSIHTGTAVKCGMVKEAEEDMTRQDRCLEVLWPVDNIQPDHTVRNELWVHVL